MGWELKLGRVVRRKQVDSAQRKSQGAELAKHLSVFQLIPIGIGATLGAGVYVLVGTVAREHSGPSLPFSFLIAGTAAALSAFCYAELASRCPSAGSAYHYSYICLGEGIAWLIGWALILEYTVGASAVARGISPNLAIFFGGEENLPAILNRQHIPGTQIVVDPCAAILVIIVTGLLCAGIKESAMVQAMVTSANVCVLGFVIVVGCIIGFQSGWPGYQLQDGYLPYGFNGMLGGAATVFFAYIGFDSVASAAEEAKRPQRDLPLGIGITLLICSCLYMLVSAVIVGIMPYYAMDPDTPISSAFAQHGIRWAMYVVTAGALAALSSTLMGSLLPQPRIFMAMARDGLLPPFFSKINKTTLVPINGTLASGFSAALLAFGMNVDQLAGMVSVGTLLAFTVVAVSILILRYVPPEKVLVLPSLQDLANSQSSQQTSRGSYDEDCKGCPIIFMHCTTPAAVEDDHAFKHMDGSTSCGFQHPEGPGYPHEFPVRVEAPLLLKEKHHDGKSKEERRRKAAALSILSICVGVTVATLAASAEWLPSWIRWCVGIMGVLLFICGFTVLSRIKQDEGRHSFGHGGGFICPFVPALPAACILINIYLLVNLGASTWLRVSVWLILGVAIYLFYGIKHSLLSESINGPTSQANQIVGALPATPLLV